MTATVVMVDTVFLSVCGGCCVVVLLTLIAMSIASWRQTRRLGRRVDLWSDDAARMQALLAAGASPAVAEQMVQGNKIAAVKACRLETGLGLTEAKNMVDHFESALYRYEPWATRTARRGDYLRRER
jgi:hypothetical protein